LVTPFLMTWSCLYNQVKEVLGLRSNPMSNRCGHLRQGRDGSNNYVNRVVCRDCGKLLFCHFYRDCNESLVVLMNKDGDRLTGEQFKFQQTTTSSTAESSRSAASASAAVRTVERLIEVPVYREKVIEVPMVVEKLIEKETIIEKFVEVPVIQTVEKKIYEYVDREKLVEVPRVIFREREVRITTTPNTNIEHKHVESQTDTPMEVDIEMRDHYVQTEIYMVQLEILEQYEVVPHVLPEGRSQDRR